MIITGIIFFITFKFRSRKKHEIKITLQTHNLALKMKMDKKKT